MLAEQFNVEVRCMAAAVRDYRGGIIGAIGFSGPVWRLSLAGMGDYITVTRAIAAELSEELGFRPSMGDGADNDTRNGKRKKHV